MSFIADILYEERARLFNFVPIFFAIGICLFFSLNRDPNIFFIIFLLVISILSFFLIKNRIIYRIILLVSAGFICSFLRTNLIDIDMLDRQVKYINLEGTICYSEKSYNGIKIILEDIKNLDRKYDSLFEEKKIGKISLTWKGTNSQKYDRDFLPGDRISLLAILDPIMPKKFKNAYDFRMQFYFNGISARGYILKPPIILSRDKNIFGKFKDKIRFAINKRIRIFMDGKECGIAQALITGNKSVIDKKTRQIFSDSGIAHILAISGLHIGIIGGFFFLFFRFLFCLFPKFAFCYDIKKIAAILSIVFVFFYLKISGESVPAIRAFIMHLIIVSAILVNRTAFSMRSVAIAALCIMLIYPESILFPSFQMSFSAVIALIAFYEKSWKLKRYIVIILALFCTSIIASLATSIFTIYTFNKITFASILANLFAVPLTSCFIMPLAIVSVLLMPFNLEYFSLFFLKFGISFLIKIADFFSKQEDLIFQIPTPNLVCFITAIFGMLILALFSTRIRYFGILVISASIIMFLRQEKPIAIVLEYGRIIGFCGDKTIYFNDMRHYRSLTNDIAKTLGYRRKENINLCGAFIEKISPNTYIYDRNGKNLSIEIGRNESEEIYEKNGILEHRIFRGKNRKWS